MSDKPRSGPLRGFSQSILAGLLAFLLGMGLTSVLTWHQTEENREVLERRFAVRSEALAEALLQRLRTYEYGVHGARGAIIGSGFAARSHATFATYAASRNIDREFPGTRGFGIIVRVRAEDESRFLEQASADRAAPFHIRQLQPHDGERWVIQYIEPEARNKAAVGLDVASESRRRAAAQAAMLTGEPQLTAPITIVQAEDKPQRAFLLLLPIYQPGLAVETAEQRLAATSGWSYAPLVFDEFLADLGHEYTDLNLRVADITGELQEPIYEAQNRTAAYRGLESQKQLSIYGRSWSLATAATADLQHDLKLPNPLMIFVAGMLVSLLIAALIRALLQSADRRSQMVEEQETLSRGVINTSPQAIVVVDEQGIVVQANQRVREIFGHSAEALQGQRIEMLLPAAKRQAHGRLRSGYDHRVRQMGARQDLRALHADGREFPVEVQLSPLRLNQRNLVVASVVDVTERRATIERLKESESRWRQLANSMPQLVWTCTASGDCDFLSERWVQYTGIPEAPQLGQGWLEQVHPDDRAVLIERWQRSVGQRSPFAVEFRIRAADGSYRWFDTQAEPLLDSEGRVLRWIGSNTDIEARKQAEAQLLTLNINLEQEVNERTTKLAATSILQRAILDHAGYSIIATDTEGLITLFNPAAEALLGYRAEEMVGHNTPALIHDAAEVATRAELLSAELGQTIAPGFEVFVVKARTQATDENEWTYVRKDGSNFPVRLKVSALRSEDGQINGFLGIAIDLTETRKRELALTEARVAAERANRDLQNILDAIPSLVSYWDQNQISRFANHAYRDWFGVNPDELPGKHMRDLLGPDTYELSQAHIDQALQGIEQLFERSIGTRHAQIRLIPDRVGNSVRGFYVLGTDISELRQATDAAVAASAAKSVFLANMSHEIRTPLNAVMNLAYLLEQTAANDDQRELSSKIRIACRSLLGLINDILDISKIEAGQMELNLEAFSLPTLIYDQAKVMGAQAANNGVAFQTEVDRNIPPYLRGDSLRINQILTNLLSNAIKFTEKGHVLLKAQLAADTGDEVSIRFSVTDTGVGIGPEAVARIFQPFVQADESTTRRYGGTGLGLAIVKRLVDLMGGQLGVESTPGTGSTFWFQISLRPESEAPLGTSSLQVMNALVAAGSEQDAVLLRKTARSLGWRVDMAGSSFDTLQQVADRANLGQPYDVILLDWHLPGQNGPQTAQELRQRHGAQTPPILLLTHSNTASTPETSAAPADGFIHDPLTASDLFDAAHLAIANRAGVLQKKIAGPGSAPTRSLRLAGAHILLVDDSKMNLEVAERILKREGAKVALAENGHEALAVVEREKDSLDLVLMDVQMPQLDGIEATRRIRDRLGLQTLPIMALTAGALVTERERALQAGMNDFITKPLDPEVLIERARCLIETLRGKVFALTDAATETSARITVPKIAGLNLSEAMNRVGQDLDFLKSLLRQLLDEFADFGLKPDASDRAQLAQRAHRLRGMAGNVGAVEVHEAATALEACARDPACSTPLEQLALVRAALARLSASTQEFLKKPLESTPGPVAGPPAALGQDNLNRLRKLLQDNSLAALDLAQKHDAALAQLLGTTRHTRFRTALEALRFKEALNYLTGA